MSRRSIAPGFVLNFKHIYSGTREKKEGSKETIKTQNKLITDSYARPNSKSQEGTKRKRNSDTK